MIRRRGGILLETLIALAVFVATASFVLAASRQSLTSARVAALESRATDVARSALAAIEAGIVPRSALDGGDALLEIIGPVRGAPGPDAPDDGGGRWELDVQTDPTEFGDLMLITVTARWLEPGATAGGPDVEGTIAAPADAAVAVTLRGHAMLSDDEAWAPELDEALDGLDAGTGFGGAR
ncbi:MAG: hypothetical protein AB8G96_08365 [Phycisphaerales bacterium]